MDSDFQKLLSYLKKNSDVFRVIEKSGHLEIPNWYVGAGCLVQTVWNQISSFEPTFGIKDIDWIYFDSHNLSAEAEDRIASEVKSYFKDIPLEFDVKNQARVHLWYEEKFGYPITPYSSVEAAIDTWPTTATAVGVRKEKNQFRYYAPFGLEDLLAMNVRANPRQITQEIYEKKAKRWVKLWPKLEFFPWKSEGMSGDSHPVKINTSSISVFQ